MTDQELKDLISKLVKANVQAEIAKAQADTQLDKTDKKLNKLAKIINGVSNNQGSVA